MDEKKEVGICFLILHYLDIDLTRNAVESILKLYDIDDCQIVVVDNGSLNGSGQELKKEYKSNQKIHVIISEKNSGFSVGNNLGFEYIKKHFRVQFVIAMNNDIVILQKDFLKTLKQLYKEIPFFVAGPDVFVPTRSVHTSPIHLGVRTERDINVAIKKHEAMIENFIQKKSLWAWKEYVIERCEENLCFYVLFKVKNFFLNNNKHWKTRKEAVVLQGSFIIFDQRYCEASDNLFEPLTFLYGEEDILALRCQRNAWKVCYFPEMQVWHLERGSSKKKKISYDEFCEKRINRSKSVIKALDRYKQLLYVNL